MHTMSAFGIESSGSPLAQTRLRIGSLRTWPLRRWLVAVVAAAGASLVIGVPTGIIETSFYTRTVGCPVCNKIVVAVLGVSGALTYWAPIQPIVGILSIALLVTGLLLRLGGAVACTVPVGTATRPRSRSAC